jgi:hypothetical protein
MNIFEMFNEPKQLTLIDALRDFLPIAVKVLNLKTIPKIILKKELYDTNVPSFGQFTNKERTVYCVINNRQPNDILRTLAHEMVHFAQGEEHELDAGSWHTGSPVENEAHEKAGIIMRHFNTKFPQYLKAPPIILPESKTNALAESVKYEIKSTKENGQLEFFGTTVDFRGSAMNRAINALDRTSRPVHVSTIEYSSEKKRFVPIKTVIINPGENVKTKILSLDD